ncbi:hypothetical protein SAMN05192563_106213 [Paraburkholderia aspalathi]|uniref:Uncharacterized protein n=1 Tax=Paraburkholderia aspalathi TaxID=1324617 RepID=A0A1I7ERW8_9BURK|nr:hypothetical protein SAMN05192563_106213 [Paraburkholderia aspalathi]
MNVQIAQRCKSDTSRRAPRSNEVTRSNLKESTSLLCSVAVVTCCPGQRFVVVQCDHTLRRIMPNSARFRSAIFCFARIPQCCASPCSASLECSSGCDGGSCCELLRDYVNFYVRMRFRRTDRHTFTSGKRQDVMRVHVALFCVNGSKVPSPGKSCSVRRPGAGCLGQGISTIAIKSRKGALASTACRRGSTALVVRTCWRRQSRAVSMCT